MLKHNLIIIFRNFKRNKSSFFINLVGLSTGLACALLIFLWVNDELNMDKFHEKDQQLFQVMKNAKTGDGMILTFEWTPGPLANALAEEMPEVESAVTVMPNVDGNLGILSAGETLIKVWEQYVSNDFFNVFSYHLIQGDRNQVLSHKKAVAISDELAIKLFNSTENIVGKTVRWKKGQFDEKLLVSGIFKKPPANSSVQFDLLFTFELYCEIDPGMNSWESGDPGTYIVLKKGTQIDRFNQKLGRFLQAKTNQESQYLFARRYSDKYLYGKFENGVPVGGRIFYVRLFSIIALLILAVACINFMNLSTAKASTRLKEVGIKKAVGANRKALVVQYLAESLFQTYLSLFIALSIIQLILPQFNEITGKQLSLHIGIKGFLSVMVITFLTGLVSGSYPAFYLSGFNPVMVLKNKLAQSVGELWIRKGLVVFQFAISVILIVSVFVVYRQINFIQTKNLGFEKDNIICFKKEGRIEQNLATFLNETKKIPGVVNASSYHGDLKVNVTGTGGLNWEGKQPDERVKFKYIFAGYNFIETLGIEMLEGRSFSGEYSREKSKLVFNEAAIQAMGLTDPVGKTIELWGEPKEIVGVVKNFHFESLYEDVMPCFFILGVHADNVIVKIKAGMEAETIERLRDFYQTYNQGLPFDFKFLDDEYQVFYESEIRVGILSRYFAGIAILISCLGLFGLAAFTAQKRQKEIGIRKVLGSSEFGIIRLLSGDFTKLVIVAIVIAMPVSYFITKNWLETFAYRIDLDAWYFIGAALITLAIAWLTVSAQAVRSALANPVEALRNE